MVHSFLIIGQSNMAGRGLPDDRHEIDTENIRVLRNGRWQPFFRPVNFDRSFSGTNLAESFAEQYAKDHNVIAGIIPCADGGTTVEQWHVGGLLHDNAVNCARLAQRSSTIAGVLWHQGEGNSYGNSWETYYDKLSVIMESLRRDLSLYDVPFVLGGLGDFLESYGDGGLHGFRRINEIQREYAEKTPMTGFAEATGLSHKGDFLHFSSDALYDFGLRYYEVFRRLEDKNKVFTEKPYNEEITEGAMERL
ncbi:MAG: sialate O-acetylesterase [Clostridia bacterium]|nr:sialate O-acetylesterase [Clostridia bacterium]